jgi:hypothetical protein
MEFADMFNNCLHGQTSRIDRSVERLILARSYSRAVLHPFLMNNAARICCAKEIDPGLAHADYLSQFKISREKTQNPLQQIDRIHCGFHQSTAAPHLAQSASQSH